MSQSRLEFYATNNRGEIVRYDTRNDVHPGYTHILTGVFISGGIDIFAYDAALGRGDIWTRNAQGQTTVSSVKLDMRTGATLVVDARLTGTKLDVVLYDAPKGEIDIYRVDGDRLTLAKTITGMKTSWTHVVRGNYNGDPYDCLFFYDAAIGRGEFWMTDGQGNLTQGNYVKGSMQRNCTSVVRANLTGTIEQNDILTYKSSHGMATIMEVQSPGGKGVRDLSLEWVPGFTHIMPVACSSTPWSDLLAYNQAKGEFSIYTTTGSGGLDHFGTLSGVGQDWTNISGIGTFRGGPSTHTSTHFVAYNRTVGANLPTPPVPVPEPKPQPVPVPVPPADDIKMTGKLALYTMDDWGMLGFQVKHEGLRAWTHVLSGSFSRGSYNKLLNPDGDLFFYDFHRGEAETVKVGADGKLTTIGKFKGLMKKAEPIVFDYMGTMGGILLYSPAGGIEVYDASLGKMTLVKTYPAWNKEWTAVVRGGFSPNAGNNDFVFHTWRNNGYREHWTLNKQGTDLKKVYEHNSYGGAIWHAMTSGRFVGNTFDDYVTYNYDTGQCYLFRGGANEHWWTEAIAGSTQPAQTWRFLRTVMLRSNKGFSDSVLAYSYSKQRAETMEVRSDGRLVTVKHVDGIGKWSNAASMPNDSITRRVAFFTPLEW